MAEAVSDGPSFRVRSLAVKRIVWAITGVLWAAAGLLLLADVEYWDPVTALDHVAVWTYSLAWLFLAGSIVLLGRLVASRPVALVAPVVAVGAAATGIANGIEDGLGMDAFGTLYVAGALSAAIGLLLLVVALARTPSPRLAIVPGAVLVGFVMLQGGFGGLIVLAAFGALAIAPWWFIPHRTNPPSEPARAPTT